MFTVYNQSQLFAVINAAHMDKTRSPIDKLTVYKYSIIV